jgi:A/G-specific adenine glycosylase
MPSYFQRQLLTWHEHNPRPLPWTGGPRDPYHIWVSEVIMQQTRIEQGAPYYHRFITKFPGVESLASADIDTVLLTWQGLGYYTRARNLHKAAKYIVEELKAEFPTSYEELLKLPGIGHYSAAAIASFAYGLPYPVVDGNVKRLIARFDGIREPVDLPAIHDLIRKRASKYLHQELPAAFNQAIMNFGSLVCKPKKPDCPICPMRKKCFAFQNDLVELLPVKSKVKISRIRHFHFLVLHHRHTVLFERRIQKDIWNGLYSLPSIETNSSRKPNHRSIEEKIKSIIGHDQFELISSSGSASQILSHQVIEARFHQVMIKRKPKAIENQYWATIGTVMDLAKPKIIVDWIKEGGFFRD